MAYTRSGTYLQEKLKLRAKLKKLGPNRKETSTVGGPALEI
jgi:hypothetical protein